MAYGYTGRILHVNLTDETLTVETPDEGFYRKYMGGSAMGAYYLLKHTPPGADPLGPENTLSLMVGVATGAPISGQSRVSATAKSPISGLADESTAGGFWPAELKFAGFDGVVIRGQALRPLYLWIHDGEAELRDARHLQGRFTADVEDIIRKEVGESRAQIIQCGPAAERTENGDGAVGVRFGALINNANRANGRGGMGAVMASKNLRAVAVRGHERPEIADPDGLKALAKWGAEHVDKSDVAGLSLFGTAGIVTAQDRVGGLPTRNWSSGTFEGAENLGGKRMAETIRKERDTCYGCAIRCKPVVEVNEGAFPVDARYGGPEYETLSTMGSYCGVSDLEAVARANQLCNMYGMDTISCGATVAWAMDCFEEGLLTEEETDGLDLHFGHAEALVTLVERIGRREGRFARALGQGSERAADILEVGHDLVVAVKGRELPAHMPQVKRGIGLLYAVDPGGADHTVYEHDTAYRGYPDRMAQLGLHDPQSPRVLNAEKVRFVLYTQRLLHSIDSLSMCKFVYGAGFQLYDPRQYAQVVRAATGWDVTLWELMKLGERQLNMLRAFNAREGVGSEADTVPPKLLKPLRGGASDGVAVTAEEMAEAKALYYQMAGWDAQGRPTRAKLAELGLSWIDIGRRTSDVGRKT